MSDYQYHQNVPILRVGDVSLCLGSSVTVSRMPLLESRTRIRTETDSQRALSYLLERRRLNYQTRQKFLHGSFTSSSFSRESSLGSVSANNTTGYFGDTEVSFEYKSSLAAVKEPVLNHKHINRKIKRVVKSVIEKPKKASPDKPPKKSSNLAEIDSKDLAERIVNQARRRMNEKHKAALNKAYLRPLRTSTPIPNTKTNIHPKTSQALPVKTSKCTAGSGHKCAGSPVESSVSSTDGTARKEQSRNENESKSMYPVTKYLSISKRNYHPQQ